MSDDVSFPEFPCTAFIPAEYARFTEIQMMEFARAAVLADRERRAQPAPGAEYFALEKDGHIQLDTRTEQLEIYETEQAATQANARYGSRYTVLKITARRADVAAHSAGNAPHQTGEGEYK